MLRSELSLRGGQAEARGRRFYEPHFATGGTKPSRRHLKLRGSSMRLKNGAASWLRGNPFRVYFVCIGLAVLPLSLFIVSAHKLFIHQVTQRVVKQGSDS